MAEQTFGICGIGINLMQTKEEFEQQGLLYAGSLKSIWGREASKDQLLKNLSICLGDNLERLKQNPQEILTRYSACCITLGREVKYRIGK